MNVFIWECLDGLTSSYHSEGGLVIVDVNLESALAAAKFHGIPAAENAQKMPRPDRIYPLANDDEMPSVIVFPNAGCC